MDENGLQVQPEFFVRDESFGYGSEVAGAEQLGRPIAVDMSLDPAVRYDTNLKLTGRSQALQHIVTGLAKFFIRRYDEAAVDFERATQVSEWDENEGKEVVYLLLGAAHLRQYDQITKPLPLLAAEINFRQAYTMNQAYGRVYLGLGAVARAEAAILCEDGTAICDADPAKLIEARDGTPAVWKQPSSPLLRLFCQSRLWSGSGSFAWL